MKKLKMIYEATRPDFYSFFLAVALMIIIGCTYKHDGILVKDINGTIYRLEGSQRTSESYHLIPVDTINYKTKFETPAP